MPTTAPPTAYKVQPKAAEKQKHRAWWHLAFESVLVIVLAIALVEVLFHVARVGQGEFFEPDELLGSRHIPGKLVTWRIEGYSHDRFSKAGLRDVEHAVVRPPGVERIALLGDSAAEGMQVPLKDTYGRVLEELLNGQANARPSKQKFEVINFGSAGYSTGQQLLQFRHEAAGYKPDTVVLLFSKSDTAENVVDIGDRGTAAIRPYFYLDEEGKLAVDRSVIEMNRDKLRPNPILSFLRAHSCIYGVLCQTDLSLTMNELRYRLLRDLWYRLVPKPVVPPSAPLYQAQDPLAVTKVLISTLNAEVKGNGGRFVLLVFPNLEKNPDFAHQAQELKALGESEEFTYLDLMDLVNKHPHPTSLFIKDHFSVDGHKMVAQELNKLVF